MNSTLPCMLGPATAALRATFEPSYAAGFERVDAQRIESFEAMLALEDLDDERVSLEIADHWDKTIRYKMRSDLQIGHDVFMSHVNCQRALTIHSGADATYFLESTQLRLPRSDEQPATYAHKLSYYTTQVSMNLPDILAQSLIGEPLSKLVGFPASMTKLGEPRMLTISSNGITLAHAEWDAAEQAALEAFQADFLKACA